MARGREVGPTLVVSGLGVGLLILLYNLAALLRGDPAFQPSPGPIVGLGVAACAAYAAIVAGPIGRALARRLLSDGEPGDQAMADIRSMFEAVQQQLAETNERLEFTERLLAQRRTPDQLPRA